jgi:hypothetical protein
LYKSMALLFQSRTARRNWEQPLSRATWGKRHHSLTVLGLKRKSLFHPFHSLPGCPLAFQNLAWRTQCDSPLPPFWLFWYQSPDLLWEEKQKELLLIWRSGWYQGMLVWLWVAKSTPAHPPPPPRPVPRYSGIT